MGRPKHCNKCCTGRDSFSIIKVDPDGIRVWRRDHWAPWPYVGTGPSPTAWTHRVVYHDGTVWSGVRGATGEQQRIRTEGGPTGGTFTLTFEGQTTSALNYDATAGQVQAALNSLSAIYSVILNGVSCFGGPLPGNPITVNFINVMSGIDQPEITGNASFSGGDEPELILETLLDGRPPVRPFSTAGGLSASSITGIKQVLGLSVNGDIAVSGLSGHSSSDSNAFNIAKYSSSGSLLWTVKTWNSGSTLDSGVALDDEGNVYFAGPGGDFQQPGHIKLDSDGVEEWNVEEGARDVAVDPDGNPIFAGGLVEKRNPANGNRTALHSPGFGVSYNRVATDSSGNVLVVGDQNMRKLNSSLAQQWQKAAGNDVAADGDGNVIVARGFSATKYDSSGNEIWTFEDDFGGDHEKANSRSVTTDEEGNIYLGCARGSIPT